MPMTDEQVRNHVAWARRIAENYAPAEGTDGHAALVCMVDIATELDARLGALAREQRVRDLVADGEDAYPLTIWPEPEQVAPDSDLAKHGERCAAAMARHVYANIRRALDDPAPRNQLADAAAAQATWRAKQPGYRDDQPGVPEPTPEEVGATVGHDCAAHGEPCDGCDHEAIDGDKPPCNGCAHGGVPAHRGGYPCLHTKRAGLAALRVGAKDTARLDVLSDLVRQSSERGECVVIDGREALDKATGGESHAGPAE